MLSYFHNIGNPHVANERKLNKLSHHVVFSYELKQMEQPIPPSVKRKKTQSGIKWSKKSNLPSEQKVEDWANSRLLRLI